MTGKLPELWHAETGTFERVSYRIVNGETVVQMALNPEEAVHVVFAKPAPADAMMLKKLQPMPISTVEGPWQVTFQAGRGAPAAATLPRLQPLNESAVPGIRYFSGLATYARDIAVPATWHAGQALWLDLRQVSEMAQVTLDGQPVGTVWHAPYRVDLSGTARPGANHLEVKVANLRINRLIGDAQPEMQKPGAKKSPSPPCPPIAPMLRCGPRA